MSWFLNVSVHWDQISEGFTTLLDTNKDCKKIWKHNSEQSRAEQSGIHNKTATSNLGFTEPPRDKRKQAVYTSQVLNLDSVDLHSQSAIWA